MSEEAKVYEVATTNSPSALLMAAIDKGADLDKLEKFMELQERWETNEARKAYHEAMAAFKANPPDILKDTSVKYQNRDGTWTEYNHSSLANVSSSIGKALSANGLSAAWKTDQDEKWISVTCTITHRLGHSESTTLKAGADTSGGKNPIQAVASTVSYLERYTILALTGLATRDMDDDGRAAVPDEFITADQVKQIKDLMLKADVREKTILDYTKALTLPEIAASDFERVINKLNLTVSQKGKATKREPGSDDDK